MELKAGQSDNPMPRLTSPPCLPEQERTTIDAGPAPNQTNLSCGIAKNWNTRVTEAQHRATAARDSEGPNNRVATYYGSRGGLSGASRTEGRLRPEFLTGTTPPVSGLRTEILWHQTECCLNEPITGSMWRLVRRNYLNPKRPLIFCTNESMSLMYMARGLVRPLSSYSSKVGPAQKC